MTDLGRFLRATVACLALAALPAADGRAQAAERAGLGLCPAHAGRLDAYVQALCDGEAALRTGDLGTATERFGAAAALPRTDASNELAWAGLAASHCRARDFDTGRQWAAHFAQARQLWLGELDCAASGDDPRAKLSPFVRSRMCTGPLEADYAAVRRNPQSSQATDLRLRLKGIDEAIAAACAAPAGAPPQAAATAGSEAPQKQASRKRGSRAKKTPKPG
jgi:hypothetical protein